ncbi:ATP-binding cassette domain-containing protein, partial [Bacillus anthracis]
DTPEMKLLMEYEELLEKVNNDISLNDKLIALQSKIDTMNLWDLESDAKTILTKLGISDFNKKMSELSGGQKKRVFLASSLITPCELLVLDEPTNHLDSESIEWLEEYLNSRKGALIMITHDRYFLDRVTNKIIELDRGNLYLYEGNYSDFLEKKAERLQVEASKEEKRQKLILKELKWVRRGAKART